jgi:Flp pilus assembly protein TadG
VLARMIRSLWRDRRGSALVEAAVLVPTLLTLTLGVYEFSWFFYKQQLIETGVRDAARYLARVAPNDGNPCTYSSGAYLTDAQNIATNGVISGGTARVSGWMSSSVNMSCTAVSNSSGSYLGASTIYLVTASTSFADPALGFFGYLGLSAPTISFSHTERSIGPG